MTGSELVEARPALIVDPIHGEQIELASASPDRLGQMLLDVREFEGRLRELKAVVNEELTARMDMERSWTLRTEEGLKLTGKSDAPVVDWDVNGLVTELDAMVVEGVLTQGGRDRAVQAHVEWHVKAAGIGALMKSPVFAERLGPYRMEVAPNGRRVSVSRV